MDASPARRRWSPRPARESVSRASMQMAARGRDRPRDRRQREAARQVQGDSQRHRAPEARCSRRRRRSRDDSTHCRARRAVQLRGLRASRNDPRLLTEGLGFQLQPQRARDVRRDPGRAAEDARQAPEDRQLGSSIINMASVAGSIKGIPNRFAYGASKAAVVGLTKAVAADFVHERHPLQRDRAGHRRHAVARRAHQCLRRSRSRRAGCSSRANRWAALPRPRRSRRL